MERRNDESKTAVKWRINHPSLLAGSHLAGSFTWPENSGDTTDHISYHD
jgi:hypothetical protein